MNILIITGGNSSEREISLISAKGVEDALRARAHQVEMFDFTEGYEALKKKAGAYDAIFPVMHGKEGEDGELYRFLLTTGVPFVGSDPEGSKIAFDKIAFKKYCAREGIASPKWKEVEGEKDIIEFGFPSVLKAAQGGSSHEVALLRSQQDIDTSDVRRILGLGDSFFVERFLEGMEITAGVLNGEPLPIVEIIPPDGGWFDYKNKYSGQTQEIPFAPSVSKDIQREAQDIAKKIHDDLSLRSYSRTDYIVVDDIPYVLEVNTPNGVGMTPESLFPKAAMANGVSFEELVERMLPPDLL